MPGFLPVVAVLTVLAGTVVLRIRRLRRAWRAQRLNPTHRWGVDGGISLSAASPDEPQASTDAADGGAFPSWAALQGHAPAQGRAIGADRRHDSSPPRSVHLPAAHGIGFPH
ncbi:MAG: hypothetical protein WCY26_10110 [Thiohalobacteraceae bacterium]